jgi:chitodextrinase
VLAAVVIAGYAALQAAFVAPAVGGTGPSSDTEPPARPVLSLGPATQTSLVLNWQAGKDNVGIDHYNVFRGTTRQPSDQVKIAETKELSYTYTALTCGTDYSLALVAEDKAGNTSVLAEAIWYPVRTLACSATTSSSGGTTTAPSGTTTAPSGTTTAPSGTTTAPSGTTTAPSGTTTAPRWWTDRWAPRPPGSPRVSSASQTTLALTWAEARDNVGVTGYDVYFDGTRKGTTPTPTFGIGALRCGTAYSAAVDAFDAAGNHSRQAGSTVTTAPCVDANAPTTPTGFRQVATTGTTILLSWNTAQDDIGVIGYGLYVGGLRVRTVSEASATLENLTCGSSYLVGVDAYDAASNRSGQASLLVSTSACPDVSPPTVPSNLSISSASTASITLGWSVSTDNVGVTGYGVYLAGARVSTTATPGGTVSGLACGTTYTLGVDAADAAGNRSALTTVSAATSACATADTQPPARPVLSLGPATQTTLALTWQAGTDNVGIDHYDVYRGTTSAASGQTKIGQTTALSYTYTGLNCGTDYSLALVAVDAAGNKSFLAEAIWYPVSTLACTGSSDAQPPTAPTNLSVGATTGTSVTTGWAPSTDNVAVTGYGIYRGTSLLSTTTGVSGSYTGLTCGTAYTLGVDAFDAAGNRSSRSNVTATTSPCPDTLAPTTPTNVVVVARTTTSIALNWAASTDNIGVTGYGLYKGATTSGTTAGTTGTFSGLTCGTSYTLAVDAVDAAGNRSQKAVQMVSTANCATPPPVACANGADDDGDAKIDLADPGCSSSTDTDETDPPPPPTSGWTFCGNEGSTCTFTGTKEVRYGAGTSYITMVATDSISCNNTTFGDPIVGTVKHCDYRSYTAPPPPPPGAGMTGWNVTPQNIGLAPLGLSCNSLPVYSGPFPIPAGTTITEKRITWSSGALSLDAGGITIQRSCMQPQPGASTTYVVVQSFTPPQPNRIVDSELDGHLVGVQAMSKACGLRGIWAEITRTYVHHVGSGICLVDYNSSLNYDVIYADNWIGDLVAFGDPGGSGSHNEAATTRCARIDTNPNRKMVWRGNHIETDTPNNTSGGLFIQTTWGCPIGNVYVENNYLDGGGNYDMYADGTGYSGQFVATNNRFAPGGFGHCVVSGFRWTSWSSNYVYDPSKPDSMGASVPSPT